MNSRMRFSPRCSRPLNGWRLPGGPRSVPVNIFCDVLTDLIAGLLIASPEPPMTAAEIERLGRLFTDKLTAAIGQQITVGHA